MANRFAQLASVGNSASAPDRFPHRRTARHHYVDFEPSSLRGTLPM